MTSTTLAPFRRPLLVGLLALLAVGCTTTSNAERLPSSPQVSVPVPVTAGVCDGQTALGSLSTTYVPDAPGIREAGTRIELVLTVVIPEDGRCVPATGALVEIWHTSPEGAYMPERWRTSLRTDEHGVVVYRTIMPGVEGEGQPHLHVRATFVDRVVEWVVGVTPETVGRVERTLAMEVVEQTGSTTTTISGLSGV